MGIYDDIPGLSPIQGNSGSTGSMYDNIPGLSPVSVSPRYTQPKEPRKPLDIRSMPVNPLTMLPDIPLADLEQMSEEEQEAYQKYVMKMTSPELRKDTAEKLLYSDLSAQVAKEKEDMWFLPKTRAGVEVAMHDMGSTAYSLSQRAGILPGDADETNRISGIMREAYKEGMGETASMATDAFSSIAKMSVLGSVGSKTALGKGVIGSRMTQGFAVMAGGFMAETANQAWSDAKEKGLDDVEAGKHAAWMAVWEGAPMMVMQAVGLGGAESMVLGKGGQTMAQKIGAKVGAKIPGKSMKAMIKRFSGTKAGKASIELLSELGEENVTSFGQLYEQVASGVKEGHWGDYAYDSLKQTSMVTAMTMGMLQGSGKVSDFVMNHTRKNAARLGYDQELKTIEDRKAAATAALANFAEYNNRQKAAAEVWFGDSEADPANPRLGRKTGHDRWDGTQGEFLKADQMVESRDPSEVKEPQKLLEGKENLLLEDHGNEPPTNASVKLGPASEVEVARRLEGMPARERSVAEAAINTFRGSKVWIRADNTVQVITEDGTPVQVKFAPHIAVDKKTADNAIRTKFPGLEAKNPARFRALSTRVQKNGARAQFIGTTNPNGKGGYTHEGIIELSEMASDPAASVRHEAIHAAKFLGLISQEDFAALREVAGVDPSWSDKQAEEAIAANSESWPAAAIEIKGRAANIIDKFLTGNAFVRTTGTETDGKGGATYKGTQLENDAAGKNSDLENPQSDQIEWIERPIPPENDPQESFADWIDREQPLAEDDGDVREFQLDRRTLAMGENDINPKTKKPWLSEMSQRVAVHLYEARAIGWEIKEGVENTGIKGSQKMTARAINPWLEDHPEVVAKLKALEEASFKDTGKRIQLLDPNNQNHIVPHTLEEVPKEWTDNTQIRQLDDDMTEVEEGRRAKYHAPFYVTSKGGSAGAPITRVMGPFHTKAQAKLAHAAIKEKGMIDTRFKKYSAMGRKIGQLYMDNLDPKLHENLRSETVEMMEHLYKKNKAAMQKGRKLPTMEYVDEYARDYDEDDPKTTTINPSILFNRPARGTGSSDLEVDMPLGEADKTRAAINLNSICPMLNIGIHGCYVDGCYLTSMFQAANPINAYQRAMYTGEILQLTDTEIGYLNKTGGLRLNGMGDTTMEQLPQYKDVLRHAKMRKLKLKIITKQDATFKILETLSKDKDIKKVGGFPKIVLQPTVDPYWIPVSYDDLNPMLRGTGKYLESGKDEDSKQTLINSAKKMYDHAGRATKVVDGMLYRKYGFSVEQLSAAAIKYPSIRKLLRPRLVLSTPKEIVWAAKNHPEFIQTWMHAKVKKGMLSDVHDGEIKDDDYMNFTDQLVIRKDDKGEWSIKINYRKSKAKAGDPTGMRKGEIKSSKATEAVMAEIAKEDKATQNKIYKVLVKNACCQSSQGHGDHSKFPCDDCGSGCGSGRAIAPGMKVTEPSEVLAKLGLPGEAELDAELQQGDSEEDFFDSWGTPKQEISSAATSINSTKAPAVFGKLEGQLDAGTTNLDIGGGKFDTGTKALAAMGVKNLVFDPYNRTEAENGEVLRQIAENPVDSVTVSNVLNVIKEPGARLDVVRQMKLALKPGGTGYITVYEGNRSGEGKETRNGYQRNRKLADYLAEVKEVFPSAELGRGKLGGTIVVKQDQRVISRDFQLEPFDDVDTGSHSASSFYTNNQAAIEEATTNGLSLQYVLDAVDYDGSVAGTAGRSATQKVRNWFWPDDARKKLTRLQQEGMKGFLADQTFKSNLALRRFQTELKKHTEDDQAKYKEMTNRILSGDEKLSAQMPEKLGLLADNARQRLNEMQAMLVDYVETPMGKTIEESIGVYTNRSFKVHRDLEWVEVAMADDTLIRDFGQELRELNEDPDISDETVRSLARELLTRNSPLSKMINRGSMPSRTATGYAGILTARKDLTPAYRRLLGEDTDVAERYANTAGKLAALIGQRKLIRNIHDSGVAEGWISGEPSDLKGHVFDLGNIDGLQGLKGKYVDQNTAEYMGEMFSTTGPGNLLKVTLALSGVTKMAQTVLSQKSHVRNAMSNVLIAVANGHLSSKHMAKAFQAIKADITFNPDGMEEALSRMFELNLLHSDTVGQWLREMMDESGENTLVGKLNEITSMDTTNWSPKKMLKLAAKLYSSGDSIWKIAGWYTEMETLKAAYKHDGVSRTEKEIEEEAADRVLNLYPTVSRAAPGIKKLARFPLMGPFPVFVSEIYRTSFNRLQYAYEDVQSNNPVLKARGVKLAVGSVAGLAAMPMITQMTKILMGISDEEEAAFRLRQPWFRQHNGLAFMPDGQGGTSAIDLGFTDPFGEQHKIWSAISQGKPIEAIVEGLGPYVQEDIAVGMVAALWANRKPTGGQVYQEGGGVQQQAGEVTGFVSKGFVPAGIRDAYNVYRAVTGQKTGWKDYEVMPEVANNFGIRTIPLNAERTDQMRYAIIKGTMSDANTAIAARDAFRNPNPMKLDTLRSYWLASDAKRRRAFDELQALYESAPALHMKREDVLRTLTVGLGKTLAGQVRLGVYVPYKPSKAVLQYIYRELPEGPERVKLLMDLYADGLPHK